MRDRSSGEVIHGLFLPNRSARLIMVLGRFMENRTDEPIKLTRDCQVIAVPAGHTLMLSQGTEESIAPEIAAIFGLGSDRLSVKLKSFRTSNGIDRAFAVSTNPSQKGIVLSALKIIVDKMKIYSVGTVWLTDRSGILRQTIAVDASGARVLPDSSHAAEFKNVKAFFLQKLQDMGPSSNSSPSPRISATAAGGKKGTKQ